MNEDLTAQQAIDRAYQALAEVLAGWAEVHALRGRA